MDPKEAARKLVELTSDEKNRPYPHAEHIRVGIKQTGRGVTDETGWKHNAYAVTVIDSTGRTFTTPYRAGIGITRPATVADVLGSLFMDAGTIDYTSSMDEWAEEMGLFPIENTAVFARLVESYTACQNVRTFLRRALGSQYDAAARYAQDM